MEARSLIYEMRGTLCFWKAELIGWRGLPPGSRWRAQLSLSNVLGNTHLSVSCEVLLW